MKKILIVFLTVIFSSLCLPTFAMQQDKEVNWHDQGLIYLENNEYNLAIDAFTKAMQQDPEDAMHHQYHRGATYALLKESKKALADLNPAQKKFTCFYWVYYYRYPAYSDLKDYKKAELDAQAMVKIDDGKHHGYHALGFVALQTKDYAKALANTNKALRICANAASYSNRGIAYIKLKEYELAIKSFDRALEIDPEYSVLYYNKAFTLQKLKQNQEAIEYYRLYLEKAGNVDNYSTVNTKNLTKAAEKAITKLQKKI